MSQPMSDILPGNSSYLVIHLLQEPFTASFSLTLRKFRGDKHLLSEQQGLKSEGKKKSGEQQWEKLARVNNSSLQNSAWRTQRFRRLIIYFDRCSLSLLIYNNYTLCRLIILPPFCLGAESG